MRTLLPLLSLATVVLAAPPMANLLILTGREADYGSNNGSDYSSEYGSDDGSEYGSDFGINMRMDDDGSDYGSNDGSDDGSEHGSDFGNNMRMDDDGSDYGTDDGSNSGSEYGSEAEDFANLTMSRAAEERAINTCGCAPVSSSDRIVGGNEVNPK